MTERIITFARLMEEAAERTPDRVAVIFEAGDLPAEHVRSGDVVVQGDKVAHALQAAGIGRGERVAIMLRNHPEFLYSMFALTKLGAITVPIDARATGDRLRHALSHVDCRAVLLADYTVADDSVAAVIDEQGVAVFVFPTPDGRRAGVEVRGRADLGEALAGPEAPDVGHHVDDPDHPWALQYTSGTTGDPKAIVVSNTRIPHYLKLADFLGFQPDDIPYTGLSLVHGNALRMSTLPSLLGRTARSVVSRKFTTSRLWDICIEYGCTTWSSLGGIATAIYAEPPSRRDRAHRVRLITSAGMPRELWVPFQQRFGVEILELYGTTEGGYAVNRPGEGPPGSFGRAVAGQEMTIFGEDDRPLPPGEVGEIVVRSLGRPLTVRYWGDDSASERKTAGGWLRTGDMGWQDEEGWLFFAHRRSDGGMRRMGEFVDPARLTRLLAEDEAVLDVYVYGVPAASGAPGERDIVAAVVPSTPDDLDPAALHARIGAQDHAVRPDVIHVLDALPKTDTEKVVERRLEELYVQRPDQLYRPRPPRTGPRASATAEA